MGPGAVGVKLVEVTGLYKYAAGDPRLERHEPEAQTAALADSRDLAASCIGVRLVKQPGDAARGAKNYWVVEVVLAGLLFSEEMSICTGYF